MNTEVRRQEKLDMAEERDFYLGNVWQKCCMGRTTENLRRNI